MSQKKKSLEEGALLINTDYLSLGCYVPNDSFDGECKEFMIALRNAMMQGNHDRSDVMTDYYDVGWYVSINIGQWQKPYQFIP